MYASSGHPSNGHSRHRGLGLLVVLAMGCVAAIAASVSPALADSCPNAALRAQNRSTDLPDCRAYELVTNPYKQGFAVDPLSYSDDGALAYWSLGSFAGNTFGSAGSNDYVATRSADGWHTTAYNPPGETFRDLNQGADALSSDLRSSVWMLGPYGTSADGLGFYLRRPDSTFARFGPVPAPDDPSAGDPTSVLASDDLSHVIVVRDNDNDHQGNLYEYIGADYGSPRLVTVDNVGSPLASVGSRACARAISGDGRVVIFAAPACDSNLAITRLWARVAGTVTVEVSASKCTRTSADLGGACNAPARPGFEDAAIDGSRVFFTTTQQLVNADTDTTNDLYACDIASGTPSRDGSVNACTTLSEISGATAGANVESVVRVSDDGSRVYFVAQGVLADNVGANDKVAVPGARNLYVWEKDAAYPTGKTTFAALLNSDDIRGAASGAQTTPDGRYLLLTTATRLVNDDLDAATDVYLYDSVERLWQRVSTDVSGLNGNAEIDARSLGSVRLNTRRRFTMTADASTVVFETAEALSPDDVDGGVDVYEWHGGHVSAITTSGGAGPAITASGADIFFKAGTLLPAVDGDTVADYYDARVGGGFDLTQPPACTGDQCQGPLPPAPGLPTPGVGAPTAQSDVLSIAPTLALRAVTATQRKSLSRTGRLRLSITSSASATIVAQATATITGRIAAVASARRILANPGTTTLTLTLSKRARTQLAVAGRLTVRIAVTSSKVALGQNLTLKLSRARRQRAKGTSIARASASAAGGRS